MRSASSLLLALFASGCAPVVLGPDGGVQRCPARELELSWGPGTEHREAVVAAEHWLAEQSPHRVVGPVRVFAPLSVEPCSVVLFGGAPGQASGLTLEAGGQLVAQGSAASPVLLRGVADADGVNRVAGVVALGATGEVMRLAHVTLEGGGRSGNARGDYLLALDGAAAQTLQVDSVTLRDGAGGGVYLGLRARFAAGSQALTVSGMRSSDGLAPDTGMPRVAPVHFVNPEAAGTLPPGVYSGNAVDHVALGSFGAVDAVTSSTTWNDRGVPYFMRGGLEVVPSAARPVLTLAAGVTLKWTSGNSTSGRGFLDVGAGASSTERATLIIAGTASKPVTLESVASQPGSWSGLELFEGGRDSRLEYLVVRHAGLQSPQALSDCSMSGNRFGIAINFRGQPGLEPSPGMVRHATVSDATSGTTGLIRGWYVTGSGSLPVDFLAPSLGNSFPGLACRQSGYVEVGPPPMNVATCTASCE